MSEKYDTEMLALHLGADNYEVLYDVATNPDAIEATWSDPNCVGVAVINGRLVAFGYKSKTTKRR
jgi:hypothetical protein